MVEGTKFVYKVPNLGGTAMSEFLFLYRGERPELSPEQGRLQMQSWLTWMKELGAKGHLKEPGHPLETKGKVVRGKKKIVTDGPFAETKDLVLGYTLIEAKDLDQAVQLSMGCPIFGADSSSVEVLPIMKMDM
jgi:hypothetical protein